MAPVRGPTEQGAQLEQMCPAPQLHSPVPSEPCLPAPISSGPPAPRHLHAQALSDSEIQLTWQHPEALPGPISKYVVEVQVAGGAGDPLWIDVDRPEETSTIVRGLNASTRYLFRVRASIQGLGDWSNTVEESTLGNGERGRPTGPPGSERGELSMLSLHITPCCGTRASQAPPNKDSAPVRGTQPSLLMIHCPRAGKIMSPL